LAAWHQINGEDNDDDDDKPEDTMSRPTISKVLTVNIRKVFEAISFPHDTAVTTASGSSMTVS
jgi:anionic cell wall polymer biosynthesis LytR-Cps2A-Psr (LCP) family protein